MKRAMEILYSDNSILVCVKPAGVLSTDEPGGLPELLRRELGDEHADVRTVHRLDRAVSGIMVLARNASSASELSRQIRDGEFSKEYVAVVHGSTKERDTLRDLLLRNKARKMTFVTDKPNKGVQEAILDYSTLWQAEGMSCVRIRLHTGRTHQIRVQFSSRGFPLVGERKYCEPMDECPLALWSYRLGFTHPSGGEYVTFEKEPPKNWPWSLSPDIMEK